MSDKHYNYLAVRFYIAKLSQVAKSKKCPMEKLALVAGVEYSQVSDIEHGKINTTISTIHTLAKALEIKEKDLFDFDSI